MEAVNYIRPHAFDQMGIIHAEDIQFTMPRQASPDYKLALIERGCREFYYRQATSTVTAGELVVVHPGEVNGSQAAGGSATVRILSLSPALLLEAAGLEQRGGPPFFSSFLISDAALAAGLLRLVAALDRPTPLLEQQTRLFDFLTLLLDARFSRGPCKPNGVERGPIKQAREYLEENYQDDVSLAQLAYLVRLNPSYLCRAFRRQIGVPPHAYLTGVRIAHARTLLATGYSAGAVAALVGFFDQAHFTRLFTRYVKTTPAAYARSVAGRSISYKTRGGRSV